MTICSMALTILLVLVTSPYSCHSFCPSSSSLMTRRQSLTTAVFRPQLKYGIMLHAATEDSNNDDNQQEASPSDAAMQSLQEKMKSWEATEEEARAATLGGVVPGRSDAFDVGLYIAFPLMVLSGLAFAIFPFIMENLDVDSVGPPPTV